jgi:hypothetical protein
MYPYRPDFSHPWLARAVFALDGGLRRYHGVCEYTGHPECILRLRIGRLQRPLVLSDNCRYARGERIIDLHLWNEQMPVIVGDISGLAWGRRVKRCFESSLRELVHFLSQHPDLADIRLIRAEMSFGTADQSAQLKRIMAHYGFETAPYGSTRRRGRLRRAGENILISMMVLARNNAALRSDSLRRDRIEVFAPRKVLERRYGSRVPGGLSWDRTWSDLAHSTQARLAAPDAPERRPPPRLNSMDGRTARS